MEEIIDRNEQLYRAIKNIPRVWKSELNKPSTAAFKDSKGLSVDRDGSRDTGDIVDSLENRFSAELLKAILRIEASFCHDLPSLVLPKPEKDNIYHAEIHDSHDKIKLTQSKLKKLTDHAVIIKLNP